jgi:hypothetical protein
MGNGCIPPPFLISAEGGGGDLTSRHAVTKISTVGVLDS